MSQDVVTVSGNKTFGTTDDDSCQCVDAAATLTIPLDTADNIFLIGDQIIIFANTASTVSLATAGGVTLNSTGTDISKQYGSATIKKVGANEWIGWGDLV